MIKTGLKRLMTAVKMAMTGIESRKQRKRVKNMLKAKTETLNKFFLNALDLFCISSNTGVIYQLNPQWETTLGLSIEEIEGRNILDFVHADDIEPTSKLLIQLSEQNEIVDFVNRFQHKDGTYRWIEWRSIFEDKKVYSIGRDITKLKLAEQKQKESEERFRLTLETAQIGLWDWDIKNDKWYASPVYYKILGYEPEDGYADEKKSVSRIHPDYVDEVLKKAKNVLNHNSDSYEYEVPMLHADGSYRWVKVSGFGIEHDGLGKVTRMLGIRMDIDQQKKTDEVLRKQEQEFRFLAKNLPDMIARCDKDCRIIYANPNLEKAFNSSLERAINLTPGEFLPGILDDYEKNLRKVIETGDELDYELYSDFSGITRCFLVKMIPERNNMGEITGALGIGRNITERKHAEINLNRLNRELRAISKCNQALLKIEDEPALLNEICRIICDEAGYLLTWVGYAENDEEKSIRPVAWAGDDEEYMANVKLSWSEKTERGRGPGGVAFRTGKAQCYSDLATYVNFGPWQESALKMGFKSVIALPLQNNENISFGILMIYSGTSYAITSEEIHLLEELANNLAYGITNLRLGNAFRQSVEKLQRTERELHTLIDNIPDCIARFDNHSRFLFVNPALTVMTGLSVENFIGKTFNETVASGNSNLNKTHETKLLQTFKTGNPVHFQHKWHTVSGIRYIDISCIPEKGKNGNIESVLAIGRDITIQKKAEEERKKHLHFFECMDKINKAFQQSTDLEKIMKDVLNEVLSIFNCDRAYLVYPCDPDAESWNVPVESARPEYPGPPANAFFQMTEDIAKKMKTLLSKSIPHIFEFGNGNTPPSVIEKKSGYKTIIAIAIYPKIGKPWEFGLHQCSYLRKWKSEEVMLLQEVGRRLEDALSSLLFYRDLKENEKKLRHTLEATEIVTWEMEPGKKKQYEAGPISQLFGKEKEYYHVSVEELLNNPFPEDKQYLIEQIEKAWKGEEDYNIEYRILLPDGKIRWIGEKGSLAKDSAGNPVKMLGVAQDITARKQNTQQIEMLSFALNNASEGIFIKEGNNTNYTYVNNAACCSLGYSREELLKLTVFDFDPDITTEALKQNISRNKQRELFESRHKTKDGRIFPVELAYTKYKYGNQEYRMTIVRDISERKKAEVELRLSEERFSAAFKLNPLSMSILRVRDSRLVDVNDVFIQSYGYTREEIINHTPIELNIYANLAERANMSKILMETGHLNNYEFSIKTKSGKERIELHNATIIKLGGEDHYLSIFQDITEKKLLEQKLLSTTVETEEKERHRFAQELHDGIGPLLASVKMLVQWVLMPESKASIQKTLEKVLSISDEAHQTIREISFNLSPHILQNFGLIEALNAFTEKIGESSPSINIEIIPGNYQNREVKFETILYRVLTECISNTLRHAKASKISVIFNEEGGKLTILYSDNGKGFNLANKKNTGLGLQNMENRLNLLNGKIRVDSKPGKGIRIFIEIENTKKYA